MACCPSRCLNCLTDGLQVVWCKKSKHERAPAELQAPVPPFSALTCRLSCSFQYG